MSLKYKVAYKLCKQGGVVAYKIYAGVYIFFVGPEILKKGMEQDLIDYYNEDRLEIVEWEVMGSTRGKCTEHRINYALNKSTIGYIKEALEIVKNMPKVFEFDYLIKNEWIFTIAANIETGEIIKRQVETIKEPMYISESGNLLDVLDFICHHLDRTYMNSKNLINKTREYKGRDMLCFGYNWIRFSEDRNLTFEDFSWRS